MAAVEAALDDAMAQTGQHTRALVVVHARKILGERYAGGFTRNTPAALLAAGQEHRGRAGRRGDRGGPSRRRPGRSGARPVRLGPSPGGHEAYMSGIIGRLTAAIDR